MTTMTTPPVEKERVTVKEHLAAAFFKWYTVLPLRAELFYSFYSRPADYTLVSKKRGADTSQSARSVGEVRFL